MMMTQAFVHDAGGADRPSSPAPLPRFSDDTESLRVMLIGSAAGVMATIHNLHRRGFAEVGAWSPLIPWGEGEMMSVMTKRWRRGQQMGNG
jgi:hypothetical protein